MQESGISATPFTLPARIDRLADMAYNLWWSWHPDAIALWRSLDPTHWHASSHNPIAMLRSIPAQRLDDMGADSSFLSHYDRVVAAFDRYMQPVEKPWFPRQFPNNELLVAYFCAEYGLHESLPIYSGGLGVLAGDHCKTASDLGLPFVGIGLWYSRGFFTQIVDAAGRQVAAPSGIAHRDAPLWRAGADGRDVVIDVPLAGRTILARVWRLHVGRIAIYLLDTDVAGNTDDDRQICARLYGGDRENRIAQEVVLGVGGVRALRALGIKPTTYHMNEGHAAFMGLERIREMVKAGISFCDAWPIEAESSIFTTHTPVPAGNEVFNSSLVTTYLPDIASGMGIDHAGMLALGREAGAPDETFAMTPLALRLSHRANGVSALHGAVARGMWSKQFPSLAPDDVPITSITNGVHTPTWIAPSLAALFSRYLEPDWLERVDDPEVWQRLAAVPDEELWAVHLALKQRLVARARHLNGARYALNPDVLTIGFARRFATYKRATLFFHDIDRAMSIISDPDRPVQFVYAGKAHPADGGGQALIEQIVALSGDDRFAGRVAFLPGYDMSLAASLVQGTDVWLNNPERPQEASGTSGQKAALNGVPNCSIRDGWWDEGFNGRNGWAFGGPIGDDDVDSEQLYDVLEQSVIPSYYNRDADDLPRQWVAIMKESIRTLAPAFSSYRMVKEYTERLYIRAR